MNMTPHAVQSSGPSTLTSPVLPGERIHTLDILRGFALLGMILVHFHQYMETDAGGVEGLIGWFTWVGVETKAWGTFAFLFGVGFAILLRGFESRGAPIVAVYLRRLFGLAIFGFIAEAFFGFHVLLEYAIWGLPLLFIRHWSNRALLITALLALAFSPLLRIGEAACRSIVAPPVAIVASGETPEARAEQAVEAASAAGSYTTLLRSRLARMRIKYTRGATYMPGVNLALFIIGLLACRRGVFDEPRRHWRLIAVAMTFGFTSWAAWWLVYGIAPLLSSNPFVRALSEFGVLHDQWLCFTYIGALTLILAYWPAWRTRLSIVGASGRMALTNYMLQVAALDYLASAWGVGLRVRPLFSLLGTLVLFGGLANFSRWWLARFRFGPAEWIWRMFTYLHAQPLRKVRRPDARLEPA